MKQKTRRYLQIQCPDKKGLIAKITEIAALHGANVLDLSQHTATDINVFFLRGLLEFDQDIHADAFYKDLLSIANEWHWKIHFSNALHKPKVALLVSKTSHCLYELLIKHREGELACEFPCILSNHPDLEHIAQQFNIPFHYASTSQGKEHHEASIQSLIDSYDCEWIVLARYMQILSPEFTRRWDMKILNIHHGFLPAFMGAKPYHQAWHKGVKIIGATAHFANEDLDQGPIVAQDILRVSDRSSTQDFVQMGKDIERKVLLQCLQRILNHQVFYAEGRTFILD
jgi:formyltetrahydrofolate deformylase